MDEKAQFFAQLEDLGMAQAAALADFLLAQRHDTTATAMARPF